MSPEAKAIRQRLKDDFVHYAPRCLKIRTKDGGSEAFTLNRSQLTLHERLEKQRAERGKVRALVLKGRQQGISTYVEGRFFWRVTHRFGVRAFVLTHRDDATQNLFGMVSRYWEQCPEVMRPSKGAANAKELMFDKLDSGYAVGTAGGREVGRSSTIQYLHGCLSPDTWIMTPGRQLRRMGDFVVGDEILTHTNQVASISFVSRQKKSALSVKMLGCSEPIVATPEHKFWTKDGMKRLADLQAGDHLAHPVIELGEATVSWSYRLDYGSRAKGAKQTGGVRAVGPETLSASFELGRLLGLYLAEGTIIRQTKTGVPSAVCFTVHQKEVERTLAWLQSFSDCWRSPPKVRYRPDSLTAQVLVHSRSFAEFVFARCGATDDKALPAEWSQNREFAQGLVVGYFSGDGGGSISFKTRRVQAPSIRAAITIGMRDALAALGYGWPTIVYRPSAVRHNRSERAQWTIRVSGLGADKLWSDMGREPLPRPRKPRENNIKVQGGYAWLPITEITDVGLVDVMDFEVDHADHSYRTLQCAVSNSEVAFWPNAQTHIDGLFQAVPQTGETEIILESTAMGLGGAFHSLWQAAVRGESEYEAIFLPWFIHEEYVAEPVHGLSQEWLDYQAAHDLTDEQLGWAWAKSRSMGSIAGGDPDKIWWKFRQEYPATADEAFQSAGDAAFISPESISRARKSRVISSGPLIIGVDPAREGRDATGVIDRQGRRLGGNVCERWNKLSTMEVAGRVARLIDKMDPAKVFVDVTGLGSGVVDRLQELGYDCVEGVNFAGGAVGVGPARPDQYRNRRAEMWDALRDWLSKEHEVQIPNDDLLAADLSAPMWGPSMTGWDSSGRLLLESKDSLVKRLGRSPDLGDAAALTFAAPVRASSGRGAYSKPISSAYKGVI